MHEVTGEMLGVTTIRQLLRQLADRTPSTSALEEEVAKFKQSLTPIDGDHSTSVNAINTKQPYQKPAPTAVAVAADLARLHAEQIDYYREQLQLREAQATAAERAREAAVVEATAAVAKMEGLEGSLNHLQAQCNRLTEALALEQERARAENRQNMLRVDTIRAETRAVEEQLRLARQLIAQRDQELLAVRTERDALAQRNATLQQRAILTKQSS
jgi:chromosome segregation ATPase